MFMGISENLLNAISFVGVHAEKSRIYAYSCKVEIALKLETSLSNLKMNSPLHG
jgi:hypothetical protein